jgi:hypothetical protein
MSNRERRLRTIELVMTPLQVVLLWVSKATAAETFLDACNQSPPPREFVANAVSTAARSSLKSQPREIVQQAVDQAQREADFLYLLVAQTNADIVERVRSDFKRGKVLLAYVHCVGQLQDRMGELECLRNEVAGYVEDALVQDSVVERISHSYFESHNVLLRQPRYCLDFQLKAAQIICEAYNKLVVASEMLDIDSVRCRLEPRIHEEYVSACSLARARMLTTHGRGEEWRAALKPFFDPRRKNED